MNGGSCHVLMLLLALSGRSEASHQCPLLEVSRHHLTEISRTKSGIDMLIELDRPG
jgi:hypothetical protein